jgi:hypothetical protein
MAGRVAQAAAVLGARALLELATARVATYNARIFDRYGVAGAAELLAYAAAHPVTTTDQVAQGFAVGLGIAAAAANAAGPGYGQIASAILGALAGIAALFAGPQTEIIVPLLMTGYTPGSEPEGLRLVRAPPAVRGCEPVAAAAARGCVAPPLPLPTLSADRSNDGATARLSILGGPASDALLRIDFEVWRLADIVPERIPASWPAREATAENLPVRESVQARAVLTLREPANTTVATPLLTIAPPLDVLQDFFLAADALAALRLDCNGWAALGRPEQVAAVRRLPDVAGGRLNQEAAIARVGRECLRRAMAGEGGPPAPLPPPPPPPPAPGAIDAARALLARNPLTLADWNALDEAAQRELVRRVVGAADARAADVVRAAIASVLRDAPGGPPPPASRLPPLEMARAMAIATGLSCAAWDGSSDADRLGFVRGHFPELDAAAARAVLDQVRGVLTDCAPPPPNGGGGSRSSGPGLGTLAALVALAAGGAYAVGQNR